MHPTATASRRNQTKDKLSKLGIPGTLSKLSEQSKLSKLSTLREQSKLSKLVGSLVAGGREPSPRDGRGRLWRHPDG